MFGKSITTDFFGNYLPNADFDKYSRYIGGCVWYLKGEDRCSLSSLCGYCENRADGNDWPYNMFQQKNREIVEKQKHSIGAEYFRKCAQDAIKNRLNGKKREKMFLEKYLKNDAVNSMSFETTTVYLEKVRPLIMGWDCQSIKLELKDGRSKNYRFISENKKRYLFMDINSDYKYISVNKSQTKCIIHSLSILAHPTDRYRLFKSRYRLKRFKFFGIKRDSFIGFLYACLLISGSYGVFHMLRWLNWP